MRAILVALILATPAMAADRTPLEAAPSPVDNPLQGLVPYAADVRTFFPHSLEFNYLPFSAIVKGYDEFDWKPIERLLDEIAARGHQAVFRIYLEYPNKKGVIPDFLVKDGLKVHKYLNTNTQPLPPANVETPDYEDKNLRRSFKNFIAALGKKYDGDPRIGFITAGLLGTWGEWHTYPKNELFASKTVQTEVMDAYEAAFQVTPVLLRYPAGEKTNQKAPNAKRKFGYHDDSFAWATLDTGKKNDDWFYLPALKSAGPEAELKWKTQPIGGEIRPEAWGKVFDDKPGDKQIQDFRRCVEETHVTWLMDSGMFEKKQTADRIKRATEKVRRMGYDFHVPGVTIDKAAGDKLTVQVEVFNRGVAPFYYDWKPEFGLIDSGKVVKTFPGSGKITDLLPGDKPRVWDDTLDLSGVKPGNYKLALRIPNTLKNGHPLRFANKTQDADAPGWLTLGSVVRAASSPPAWSPRTTDWSKNPKPALGDWGFDRPGYPKGLYIHGVTVVEGQPITNPVIYDNDVYDDVFDDELALVMASLGKLNLVGLIVTPVLTDGWGFSKPEWKQTAHAVRRLAEASGLNMSRIPEVAIGTEAASEKEGIDKVSAGAKLYVKLIQEQFKNDPSKPLIVNIGGQGATLASAWKLDPTIADRCIVYYTDIKVYNGHYRWASELIAKHFRVVSWGDDHWWITKKGQNEWRVLPRPKNAEGKDNAADSGEWKAFTDMKKPILDDMVKQFQTRGEYCQGLKKGDGYLDGTFLHAWLPGLFADADIQKIRGSAVLHITKFTPENEELVKKFANAILLDPRAYQHKKR